MYSGHKKAAVGLLFVVAAALFYRVFVPEPSPAQTEVLEHIMIIASFIIGLIVSVVSVRYVPGGWGG